MNVTFSRFAHAAMAALMAGSLAACGGGSSGGVNVGGGGGGGTPPTCISTQGGGSGFALGSCLATHTSKFQPIVAGVTVNAAAVPGQDGFVLSLTFPAALALLDEPSIGFTVANQPPSSERNIVGVLRGQAYESPLNTQLTPPYVALTDFHRNWTYTDPVTDPPLLQMSHASFGTWEKFAGSTTNDGFLGVWYAPRALANDYTWPGVGGTYVGAAVGVIAPDGSSGAALDQPYGFSAQVSITVDSAGQIAYGKVDSMTIRYRSSGGWTVEGVPIKPIVLSTGAGPSTPQLTTTGALSTVSAGADMNLTEGDYQANYFAAAAGPQGAELAGQLRFKTDKGLVGIASFGTVRQ